MEDAVITCEDYVLDQDSKDSIPYLIVRAHTICANCRFFDWSEDTRDDSGTCSGTCSKQVRGVDGKDLVCSEFVFDPPCLRRRR